MQIRQQKKLKKKLLHNFNVLQQFIVFAVKSNNLLSGQYDVVNKSAFGSIGNIDVHGNLIYVSRDGENSFALSPIFVVGDRADIG